MTSDTTTPDRTKELKARVEARKHELMSRLRQAEADARGKASDEADRLRSQLNELQKSLSQGWENLNDKMVARLNEWLKNAS